MLPIAILCTFVLAFLSKAIYNVYFHPLRKYPGPWIARASRLPFIFWQVTGYLPHSIEAMHEKYGDIVRIAPNDLSFLRSQAWFDIHGHQMNQRQGWFERDPSVYPQLPGRAPSILLSSENDHRRFRRLLSHAFSEKALHDQEPLIQSYIDLLIKKLYEQTSGPQEGVVNISDWLNFATFDIVGDLSFGEPFGCLRSTKMHPWIEIMFSSLRDIVYLAAISHLPGPLRKLALKILETVAMRDLQKDKEFAADRVNDRLQQGSIRKDFVTPILEANDDKGMTVKEIQSSFNIIVVAGSETTATLLTGALYLLSQHPQTYSCLMTELFTRFPKREGIDMAAVKDLTYLNAVLEESLRIYPPSAFNQARIVPGDGAYICGEYIPGGTAVGVGTLAAFHSSRNWEKPDQFIPERWCGEEWPGDDRRVMQPFLTGPRNCIGKNLAYAEMRLMLANILLHFDYDVLPESRDWLKNQRFYLLWERPPLTLKLKPRVV